MIGSDAPSSISMYIALEYRPNVKPPGLEASGRKSSVPVRIAEITLQWSGLTTWNRSTGAVLLPW